MFLRLYRKDIILIATIAFIAATLRIYYGLHSGPFPITDPWRHLALIGNLQLGEGYTLYADQPYILYPPTWYLVASVVPFDARWLSGIFSIATTILMYLIAMHLFNRHVAILSSLLWAAQPHLIWYTTNYSSESLALFLLTSSFLIIIKDKKPRSYLLSGILYGLCIATRQNFIFAAFAFLPALFEAVKKNQRKNLIYFLIPAIVPTIAFGIYVFSVIQSYEYLFFWDAMGIPTSTFNIVNIFFPYSHEDIVLINSINNPVYWWENTFFLSFIIVATFSCWKKEMLLWIFPSLIFNIVYLHGSDARLLAYILPALILMFSTLFYKIGELLRYLCNKLDYTIDSRKIKNFALYLGILFILSQFWMFADRLNVIWYQDDNYALVPEDKLLGEKIMINSVAAHPVRLQYTYPDYEFYGLPYHSEYVIPIMNQYNITYVLIHENRRDPLPLWMTQPGIKDVIDYVKNSPHFKKIDEFTVEGNPEVYSIYKITDDVS